jgi:alpha-D-ribose 1-methylphosphonate 5-triphosphate diphosphatase
MQTLIREATLVLPDRLIDGGWLMIEDTRILALGDPVNCPASADRVISAGGDLLMPGLVDLHSDAIEKAVQPRPNVSFPMPGPLLEMDWRLAGSGITTEFHALSLDDAEFGVRSEDFVDQLAAELSTGAGLLVRHRLHARLEITSDRGEAAVARLIRSHVAGLVSLMDHTPGQGQYPTEQSYLEYVMATTGWATGEVTEHLVKKRQRAQDNAGRVGRTVRLAREYGIALATHDDDSIAKVEQWSEMGMDISEFPTTLAAALRAKEVGLSVCMGAPNVLLGRSSGGHVSALEAVRAGAVDILCADYLPVAMLAALFKLVRDGYCTLPQAASLVTANPARAVKLTEYGALVAGNMADLILVQQRSTQEYIVRMVLVDGQVRVSRSAPG